MTRTGGAESAGAPPGFGWPAAENTGAQARAAVQADPRAVCRRSGTRTPAQCPPGPGAVDAATGRLVLESTDIALPGVLGPAFSRTYESSYPAGRWLGPKWACTVDQRLEIDDQGIILVCEDGALLAYPHPEPGRPVEPAEGPRWPLAAEPGGGWTVTDPATGRIRHFAPGGGPAARLERITDRAGHWIAFSYGERDVPTGFEDGAGRRVRITAEDGRIKALHLDGPGRGTELVRFGYSGGRLVQVTGSSGLPLRFGHDDLGRITSCTDTANCRFEYAYDDHDRCVRRTGPGGRMEAAFAYRAPGGAEQSGGPRVTEVTGPGGALTRYLVNEAWQVVAETDPLGATTSREWDRHDLLLARTDPLAATTRFERDEAGRVVRVVHPDGSTTAAEYGGAGLPVAVTGPDGGTWRQEYDQRGNRTALTDPAGATTRFGYDEAGNLASVTDPEGNTTLVRCDPAGLPVEATDPLGGVTAWQRDAFGRPTAVTDPCGAVTRLEWTAEGRLARRVDPDGASRSWTYDGEGNCTAHTDPLGAVTRAEYSHCGRPAARITPDGGRYEFVHDDAMRLVRVVNPQGLAWSYQYDPAGRLTAETDFDGRTLRYTYDAAGRLTARTNALGETVGYRYDALGHLVGKDTPAGSTEFVRDRAGRLLRAEGPDAPLVVTRDPLGRVLTESCDGRSVGNGYDAAGRRVRRTTPAGAVTTWRYDGAGRAVRLSASGRTVDFGRDQAGRETTRSFGESVALACTRDGAGRITGQSLSAAVGTVYRRSFAYREDGLLTAVDDPSGRRTFDLDAAGRVTAVHGPGGSEHYTYDLAGNQKAAHWPSTFPAPEARGERTYAGTRITRAGSVRYEYDGQGRMVVRERARFGRDPDTWRCVWDAEDRLVSVTTPDGTVWRYRYDPLGRRTAKQRLAGDGTVAEQTVFTWDGGVLAEQTTTAGSVNAVTLTWDHEGPLPVTQTERITDAATGRDVDERFFAVVGDPSGTPTHLVDETGTTAWRTRATLWGATTWPTHSTAYTPLRFPGQYHDPETGLHCHHHRYYDPATARYTAPDPRGLTPSPNPAAYVDNPHLPTTEQHPPAAPGAPLLWTRTMGTGDWPEGFAVSVDFPPRWGLPA